jgi:hypothetical protein
MMDKQLCQTGKIRDESYFVSLLAERLREEALEEADNLKLAIECEAVSISERSSE